MSDGDIHNSARLVKQNAERIQNLTEEKISDRNKELLLEFKDYLYSQDLSNSRIARYLYTWYRLAPFIDFDLDNPEKKDLVSLVGKINQSEIKDSEMAEETKKEYKKAVKKFFKDFIDTKVDEIDGEDLTSFFTLTVKSKYTDPDHLPTPDTVKKLVKRADRIRDKAFLMTLWSTAGRTSEILGLKWKDVKVGDDIATVTFRDTKTGGDRTVPMIAGYLYLRDLKEYDHRGNEPEAFVFRGLRSDEQLSYQGASQIIKRTREKADIAPETKTNPHAFRKGRATYLAAQGMNQAQLCEFGGWVQGSKEVAVYIRMAEKDVEQGIRKIAGFEDNGDSEPEEDLNPVRCHICKKLNKFEADNCKNCGETLETSVLFDEVQIQKTKDKLKTKMIEEDIGMDDEDIRSAARELLDGRD